MLKSLSLILALFATALAQNCDTRTLEACKQSIAGTTQATCSQFEAGPRANATMVSVCQCYFAVENVGCYNLCTTNTTLNAERDGDAVPKRDAACRAAGLNPAVPLPRPAPWETVTTTSAAAAPTAAPTGASPSPAPSNNATTQGNKNAAVGMNAATGLVGVAAAGLVGVMALVL